MKKDRVFFVLSILVMAFALGIVYIAPGFRAEAQRSNAAPQWEYASISGPYLPFSAENSSAQTTAAVNICYMQTDGCRNEEVQFAVAYAKFFQEYKLDNNEESRNMARSRALDGAFARAIAKLGHGGWELVSTPRLEFDNYVLNSSNGYTIQVGNKERKPDLFFRRSRPGN